jgi:hypothetical protein
VREMQGKEILMSWWGWLAVGICIGLLIPGIPLTVWYLRASKDWDRAWGMR